jgi:hypothetical protein
MPLSSSPRIGLALVGGLLIAVDQHHLDPGIGRDIGDAGAHHARAEHAEFLDTVCRARRGGRAFLQRLLVEEEVRIIASEVGFISTR